MIGWSEFDSRHKNNTIENQIFRPTDLVFWLTRRRPTRNQVTVAYCQFPDNSLECVFALKSYSLTNLNIPTRTHRQALDIRFFVCPQCQNLHTKNLINLQECLFQLTGLFQFRAFRISYYLGRQIFKSLKTNMCTQPKGPMGKSKALETARKMKLLSSHEHLKKYLFQPTPPVLEARPSHMLSVGCCTLVYTERDCRAVWLCSSASLVTWQIRTILQLRGNCG